MNPVLELDRVTKEYPGSPAVRALAEVTLTVEEGELIAVVGASGSGKSTLLNVVGTLARPTSGSVRLEGRDTATRSDRALAGIRAGRIGFVFQQFHLLPGLTSVENVAAGLMYRGVRRHHRRDAAIETLHRVGLGHRIHHKPSQLSGGERQRVAIARAIVGDPALVLADEPTGNLDSHTSREIIDLILGLNQQGSTILLITHDAEIARRLPRHITIADGRVRDDSQPTVGVTTT